VIHVNFRSASVDPVYFPQTEVVGDIAQTIARLNETLPPDNTWDLSFALKTRDAMRAHLAEGTDDDRFPIYPQRLVADVRRVMPHDGIIALDNGIFKIWFARNYPAIEPNTVLLDNALASMGAGLPSAMTAKLVHPEKKVVAICGDGGFMMNSQELETAMRLRLNLVVLILSDNGYGMIKWKQTNLRFPDFGLDFGNPDFVKYANSYGAHGHRLRRTSEFVPLLRSCLDAKGIHLIDIPIDYSENDRILNRELPERAKALRK